MERALGDSKAKRVIQNRHGQKNYSGDVRAFHLMEDGRGRIGEEQSVKKEQPQRCEARIHHPDICREKVQGSDGVVECTLGPAEKKKKYEINRATPRGEET